MANSSEAVPVCRVRPACRDDEKRLLDWRNDPWVVSLGLSQRGVNAEEHRRWFGATLQRRERELYIVELNRMPCGMVRYDFHDDREAEVSIYLLPPNFGHGHGRQVFLATAPEVAIRRGLKRIIARVRAANGRSLLYFRRLGFEDTGASGADSYNLVLNRDEVPHSRPWLGQAEAAAVQAVIASGHIAQGSRVKELEQRWAELTGTRSASAVASGLSALRLSLAALGVRPGDEVIVPAYSCVALLNAVLAVGAEPVLADVIPDQWTLSIESARRRLSPRTKAVIAVHLFGFPADMEGLSAPGIPVIEDCAHGVGGHAGGAPFGGAGSLSVSSFYATKMVAAGEGGVVAGNDPDLLERVREARDYADRMPDGGRLNDKMTDIEAALALAQLARLPDVLCRRAERARTYSQLLQPLVEGGLLVLPVEAAGRVWYRYAVRLTRHRASEIVERMASLQVRGEQPVWDLRVCPYWRDDLRGSAEAFERVISLPLYPDLSEWEQRLVCAALGRSLHDG